MLEGRKVNLVSWHSMKVTLTGIEKELEPKTMLSTMSSNVYASVVSSAYTKIIDAATS